MSVKKYVAKSWHCAGCVQVGKMIGENSNIKEVDIDTLSRADLKDLNIRAVPVLIAFDSEGNELERLSGVPSQNSLDAFLERHC